MKSLLMIFIVSTLILVSLGGIDKKKSFLKKQRDTKPTKKTLFQPKAKADPQVEGYVCSPCHESCKFCSAPNDEKKCTACKTPHPNGLFLLTASGTCIGCPSPNCADNGECNATTAQCECKEAQTGEYIDPATCSKKQCKNNCASCEENLTDCLTCNPNRPNSFFLKDKKCIGCPEASCSENGNCDRSDAKCKCYDAYNGDKCETKAAKMKIKKINVEYKKRYDNSPRDEIYVIVSFRGAEVKKFNYQSVKYSVTWKDLDLQIDLGGWHRSSDITVQVKESDTFSDDVVGSVNYNLGSLGANDRGVNTINVSRTLESDGGYVSVDFEWLFAR